MLKNNEGGEANNNRGPALPMNPGAALQRLVRVSQSLLMLAEKETQALLQNDMLAFSILQYEKEKLAGQYAGASAEFRSRLNEFHGSDRNLLNRLQKLQRDLAEKSTGNNTLVKHMHERALKGAKRGLRAQEEAGRNAYIRFNDVPVNDSLGTEGA